MIYRFQKTAMKAGVVNMPAYENFLSFLSHHEDISAYVWNDIQFLAINVYYSSNRLPTDHLRKLNNLLKQTNGMTTLSPEARNTLTDLRSDTLAQLDLLETHLK